MEGWRLRVWAVSALAFLLSLTSLTRAACTGCTSFSDGVPWGTVFITNLTEASGIAASWRNPGVLWTHNDGGKGLVFAISTNGAHLGTFDTTKRTDDVEDIAVGPGPVSGVSYIYVGDIGGDVDTNDTRDAVRVIRVQEPVVDLSWASSPRILDFDDAMSFTLEYPDGNYVAKGLMVDPFTANVFVVTTTQNLARVYMANVNGATNQQRLIMKFIRALPFDEASAADISPDGTQIIFRRENSAKIWQRCDQETIYDALGRISTSVPVIGRPTEPNGEALGFLSDNSGYVTISDSTNRPIIYFFQATCPRAPYFLRGLENQSAFSGATVRFTAVAGGFPAPTYEWRFNGQLLAGQTGSTLTLSNVTTAQAGEYQIKISNQFGSQFLPVLLTVRSKPNLRITEAMPDPLGSEFFETADWWELTSFESQPVNLTGWRFNDSGGGLTDPFTISNSLVIAPGESIVFVENISATQFSLWWWASVDPPARIVTYSGVGFSLGASGDGLRLWDATATDVNDTIARVDFGEATEGISFGYNPATQQFGELSAIGVNGGFKAFSTADIGSPGRIRTPPPSPLVRAKVAGENLRIEFDAVAGCQYTLEMRTDISAGWSATSDSFQATTNGKAWFVKPRAAGQRYYRVKAE
jgi:hypothetical protein